MRQTNMYSAENPFVCSSTGFIAFGRCPKSFEIGYVDRYRIEGKACMKAGSEFHFLMQRMAEGATEDELEQIGRAGEFPSMYSVFEAYRKYHGHRFPAREQVLKLEEPIYTKVLPNFYLRTTFDRLWIDGTECVDTDFKTFDKAMQLDLSLDTQGLIFLTILRRYYGERFSGYRRDYEEIRRTPPFAPKNETQAKLAAAGKPFESWSLEDCYKTYTRRLVPHEEAQVWAEMQSRAEKILWSLAKKEENPKAQPFDRVFLKGSSPFCCGNQICRPLCMRQFLMGGLTELDLITEGVTVEEAPTIPQEVLRAWNAGEIE